MAMASSVISNQWPEELVGDILARLPPKSLVRFKCVQQSWNDLFKTPTFVKKHLHAFSLDKSLMVFHDSGEHGDHHHDHKFRIKQLKWDDTTVPPQDVPLPFPDDAMHDLNFLLPYGPCNGIFFLFAYFDNNIGRFMLWNPATKEVRIIPPSRLHPPSYDLEATSLSFGFGFDPITDNFKVVRIFNDDSTVLVEVYSLATNSWTIVHDVPGPCLDVVSCDSIHADGFCYWISSCPINGRSILCFDLATHKFLELSVPIFQQVKFDDCHAIIGVEPSGQHFDYVTIGSVQIYEVNGTVAYVAQYVDGHHYNSKIEIWALTDVFEGRWTNVLFQDRIDLAVKPYSIVCPGDGVAPEIVAILNERSVVSYSLGWQPVRVFNLGGPHMIIQIVKYVGSMVPLNV